MRLLARWCLIATLVIFTQAMTGTLNAGASEHMIGVASRVQGMATAINDGDARSLDKASPILRRDQLATSTESRLEVTFTDGSLLTMGADASLKVDDYVFQSPDQKNSLQLLAVGAFKLVSGAINKPEADAIKVVTPVGALAVRGTDIWAGPIDGGYGVFLLDGQVSVTTNAGSVTLTEPGTGTNLTDINSPPGEVSRWPQSKVDRALAAVSFQ